jgi:hypothetical protein
MKNSRGTLTVAMHLALFLAAAPATALTLVATADPYYFIADGSGNSFRILGRSVALNGHNVYVEQVYTRPEGDDLYNDYVDDDARDRELKEFYENKHLLLADATGREYEALNARFVRFQDLGWDSNLDAQIIEFSYPAEASGHLELVVKIDEESATRVDIGPADKNYYRHATVTADEGLNFRVSPNLAYKPAAVLKAGDTLFLLGGRSCSFADKEMKKEVHYYEVIRGGREGWVARGVEGEWEEYFTIGDFAAF